MISTLRVPVVVFTLLTAWLNVSGAQMPDTAGHDTLLARLQHPGATPLRSYTAVRELKASTRQGRTQGELTARTHLSGNTDLSVDVRRHAGSSVIVQRVLMAALSAERDLLRTGEAGRGTIAPDNYDFLNLTDEAGGRVRIGVRPKRTETMLVNGSVLVNAETAEVIEVDGLLAKRPSFWTRRVLVLRRYERIGGVNVPVQMTSQADVLVVGRSSFEMTYCYEEINETPIGTCGSE